MSEPRSFISTAEAARRLDVCTKTIRRWVSVGTLTAYKAPAGRTLKFDAAEVDALLHPLPTVGTIAGGATK